MAVLYSKLQKGAILCAVLIGCASPSSAQTNLFQSVSPAKAVAPDRAPEPGVVRQRFVTLTPTAAADIATTSASARLNLNFFDDVNVKVDLGKAVSVGNDGYIRAGALEGKPLATFQMSVVGEATIMDVRMSDGVTYSLRYRGNGLHEVEEIMESAQPPCGVTSQTLPVKYPKPISDRSPLQRGTVAADSAAEIDVLVAYTQEAEDQAGGPGGMQALINQAFAFANTSYANSLVPLTLLKAATVKVDYTPDSSGMQADLSRLRSKTDGYMDEIHGIRDSSNADMVCLLRGNTVGGNCGLGYVMTTESSSFESNCFVVCANTCINNQTFAHELGHNMGCRHDEANSENAGAFPYSYGWRWNGTSTGNPQFRSVMAYAPGARIQYFSSPDVNYDGTPTGVSGSADNALSIRNTADTVANFRQRTVTPGPTLFAAPAPVVVSMAGNTSKTVTIELGNSGTGSVNYSVNDDASWASISPLTGTVTGSGSNSHTITLDSTGLANGIHNASLTVTDAGATNSPLIISIQLTVANLPPNDNFANAQIITGVSGTVAGTNENATRETGEPATVGEFGSTGLHSIWYSWTAPASYQVTFTTLGSTFDTLLGAYTGNLGSLTKIADNDDVGIGGSERTSRITFEAVSGTTYTILIDGNQGLNGPTQLNWSTPSNVEQWPVY